MSKNKLLSKLSLHKPINRIHLAVILVMFAALAAACDLNKLPRPFNYLPQSTTLTSAPVSVGAVPQIQDYTTDRAKQALYSVSIHIDQITSYSDRYFVKGTINQSDNSNGEPSSVNVHQMLLFDSTGKQIQIEPIYYDYTPSPKGVQFSFYTENKGAPGKLTLVVPSIIFTLQNSNINFKVDFGNGPKNGQTINISPDFTAFGHKIHITSASLHSTANDLSVQFKISGDENLRDITISDSSSMDSEQSFSEPDKSGQILVTHSYFGKINLAGIHLFTINNFSFAETANWQTSFQPEELAQPGSIPVSEFNNACVTPATWKNLLTQTAKPFPKNITGHLLLSRFQDPDSGDEFAVADLPSFTLPNRFFIKEYLGAYALSPHGKYLIYSINYDRIHIRSIESGKEYDFPAPSRFSTDDIVFSKNSETVTYNSGGSIYIANFPDFTTKQVIKNPGFLAPVGWLSENQNLLAIGYVEKAGGGYLYTIDLLSGQIQKSSAIKDIVGFVMLAPNKQQILFRDNIIDSTSRGVFISNLDGTGHRLLLYYDALDDLNDLNSLAWSQDGKWVLISLYGSNNSYINLLVNPVTCESYRLDVTDWAIDQWIN